MREGEGERDREREEKERERELFDDEETFYRLIDVWTDRRVYYDIHQIVRLLENSIIILYPRR